MKLRNPFSKETRNKYLYEYACQNCGRSDRGGELHHITGRHSNSIYNAILLCIDCHGKCVHSQKEEDRYLVMQYNWLKNKHTPNTNDYTFLQKHRERYARCGVRIPSDTTKAK